MCCSNPFVCQICNRRFITKSNLVTHQLLHSSEAESYYCHICDEIFHEQQSFILHHRVHDNVNSYQPLVSEDISPKENSPQSHRKAQTDVNYKPTGSRPCKKNGNGRSDGLPPQTRTLTGRVQRRSQNGNSQKLRPPRISSQDSLSFHGNSPTNANPSEETTLVEKDVESIPVSDSEDLNRFVCKTCGKAFKSRKCLALHERVHSGLKPFKCTTCLQAFRLKILLTRHKGFTQMRHPAGMSHLWEGICCRQ
ncbi:putative zinc finger protein [Apostichopus japonicus]|uniref:Putative zinc finger protein n=1 Tax=Stichopus japonicus TaxID=307972 RepID=A0A2G8LJ60_STIJA|nr:putative zinc finger protein [Apostichopus japonicus]